MENTKETTIIYWGYIVYIDMGGCQTCGPCLGALSIRCGIIIGIQKKTIILTTTHIDIETLGYINWGYKPSAPSFQYPTDFQFAAHDPQAGNFRAIPVSVSRSIGCSR